MALRPCGCGRRGLSKDGGRGPFGSLPKRSGSPSRPAAQIGAQYRREVTSARFAARVEVRRSESPFLCCERHCALELTEVAHRGRKIPSRAPRSQLWAVMLSCFSMTINSHRCTKLLWKCLGLGGCLAVKGCDNAAVESAPPTAAEVKAARATVTVTPAPQFFEVRYRVTGISGQLTGQYTGASGADVPISPAPSGATWETTASLPTATMHSQGVNLSARASICRRKPIRAVRLLSKSGLTVSWLGRKRARIPRCRCASIRRKSALKHQR